MRLMIDDARCTGNGRCYALLPDLFTDDERGHGRVVGDGALGDDQAEAARRAVVACPEDAITIKDQ
jgi:ferredoxin